MRNRCAAVLALCCLLGAQGYEPTDKFSKASVAASEARTKKIQQELRHLKNHEWRASITSVTDLELTST